MSDRCVILGAGGHARVLLDCLRAVGARIHGLLDPEPARWGTELDGARILGSDDLLPALARGGVTCFAIGVGGVTAMSLRRTLFERAGATGLRPLTVVHPSAVVSPRACVGAGAQIFPGAVVNAGASIGIDAIVNTGAIVEHDCAVGDHAHVATGARLAGGVRVEAASVVGAGATVRQGIVVGREAVVGAGAVVVRDVPPGAVVAGVPARALARP